MDTMFLLLLPKKWVYVPSQPIIREFDLAMKYEFLKVHSMVDSMRQLDLSTYGLKRSVKLQKTERDRQTDRPSLSQDKISKLQC